LQPSGALRLKIVIQQPYPKLLLFTT